MLCDVGTIHNPMTHQGQIDGAIMQGVCADGAIGALKKGTSLRLGMGEVKTPTMQDMPELVTVLVESPGGNGWPYGAKTIGEQPLPPRGPRPSPTPSTMRWASVFKTCPSQRKSVAALQQR